jgi:hypothetical protein
LEVDEHVLEAPSVQTWREPSSALSFNGTERTLFDFEFDAGMRHTRVPRSIWTQVAFKTSFSRLPILRRKRAIRQTDRLSSLRSTVSSRSSCASSR